MVATPYNKKANPVFLIDQATGLPYNAEGGIAGAVTIANGLDATQGAIADAAVTNPASSATVVALLKGIVTLSVAANALLTTAVAHLAAIESNTDRIP